MFNHITSGKRQFVIKNKHNKGLNIIQKEAHHSSRFLLTSAIGLLYTNAFTVWQENGFTDHDFQHLKLIFDFRALRNGNKGLIPKNYCLTE